MKQKIEDIGKLFEAVGDSLDGKDHELPAIAKIAIWTIIWCGFFSAISAIASLISYLF